MANKGGIATGVLVVLLAVVIGVLDPFRRDTLLIALCFSICAGCFDLSSGFLGLRSLGPIVPFGLGAYIHAVLLSAGTNIVVSFAASLVLPALAGMFLVWLVLGRRPDVSSWTVFGLVASIALQQVALASTLLLGGSNGITVARYLFSGGSLELRSLAFSGFVLCFFAVSLLVCARLVRGSNGVKLLFGRYDPERLQTFGQSLLGLRLSTTFVQWAISGLAGACFAAVSGTVDPSVFGLRNNLVVIVAAVAFGERTLVRAALVAFFFILIDNLVGSAVAGLQTLLLGLLLIVVLLYRQWRPEGADMPRFSLGPYGFRM